MTEAFATYLSGRGPYYVAKADTALMTAIGMVRGAGGVPVLAHPRSRGAAAITDAAMIRSCVDAGLVGIEVDHPDHGPDARADAERSACLDHGRGMDKGFSFHKHGMSLVDDHHRLDLGLGDLAAVDDGLTGELQKIAPLLELFHMNAQLVSRHGRLAELGSVDGEEINQRRFAHPGRANADGAGRLRHRLDDENAGHHRLPRKMTEEKLFVHRHVLDADGGIVAVDLDDAVDHQEGVAVWQQFHQPHDIDRFERRAGRVSHACLPCRAW